MELPKESASDAAEVWVEGSVLTGLVDRRARRTGNPGDWVKESVGNDQGWIGAFLDEKLVGWRSFDPMHTGQARRDSTEPTRYQSTVDTELDPR